MKFSSVLRVVSEVGSYDDNILIRIKYKSGVDILKYLAEKLYFVWDVIAPAKSTIKLTRFIFRHTPGKIRIYRFHSAL